MAGTVRRAPPDARTCPAVARAAREGYGSRAMLHPELFRRLDESPDADFYAMPRLVTHIDDATITALTALYRERIPAGARGLDLMSSWIPPLPADVADAWVAGPGMDAEEAGAQRRPLAE